jgi:hypothetical protein
MIVPRRNLIITISETDETNIIAIPITAPKILNLARGPIDSVSTGRLDVIFNQAITPKMPNPAM